MTVRVLVDAAPDPETGLAVAMRCTMDIYVRMPHDVVLVVPEASRITEGPLGGLIGADAAARVAEEPQPFAGHTMRVIGHDALQTEDLEEAIVVLREATPELVDLVEKQKIAGLVAVPEDATKLIGWAERTHADIIRAQV